MGDVVAVVELLERNFEQVAAGALVLVQLLVGVVAHVPDRDVLVDPWHERLGSLFALRVGGVSWLWLRVVYASARRRRVAAAGLLCARVSSDAALYRQDATRSKASENVRFDGTVSATASPALALQDVDAWRDASVLQTASRTLQACKAALLSRSVDWAHAYM